ncbi:hypothetical protein ISCGN_016019 [Ixodes scapularis]
MVYFMELPYAVHFHGNVTSAFQVSPPHLNTLPKRYRTYSPFALRSKRRIQRRALSTNPGRLKQSRDIGSLKSESSPGRSRDLSQARDWSRRLVAMAFSFTRGLRD